MSLEKPDWYLEFFGKYPEIGQKYEALGEAVHKAGPLDEKTRALLKLAISGTAKTQQAFRRHVQKARKEGLSREEIEHAVLLTLPTTGFPAMMVLLYIVNEEFNK